MTPIEILEKGLDELKQFSRKRIHQLKMIESNTFWSYKEVLPYTINILFSDSFKPKNSFSQAVHFLHNIVVAVFLLGFIVSLLQNSITQKETEFNIEERLYRIEKTLHRIEKEFNKKGKNNS